MFAHDVILSVFIADILQPDDDLLPVAAQAVHYMQKEMGLAVAVEEVYRDTLTKALQLLREEEGGTWGRANTKNNGELPPLEVFKPLESSK
jgi:hypothetical protein